MVFSATAFLAAGALMLPGCAALPTAGAVAGVVASGIQIADKVNQVAEQTEATVCKVWGVYYAGMEMFGYNTPAPLQDDQEKLAVFCSGDPVVGSTPAATLVNLAKIAANLLAAQAPARASLELGDVLNDLAYAVLPLPRPAFAQQTAAPAGVVTNVSGNLGAILAGLWGIASTIVTICSLVVGGTPTPDPTKHPRLAAVYKLVELAAVVTPWAKQTGLSATAPSRSS